MRFAVLLALSSSLLLTGCKTNCRQLSEKLCDCTTSTTEKTACLQVASSKETSAGIVTQADEELCQTLLASCDCRLIDTPAGKERCGIAVSADAGQ
jgi:hypothetical protein